MENHNGLLTDFTISQANGTADWIQDWHPRTLAGDRGYGTNDGVREMRTADDAAHGPAPALISGSTPFLMTYCRS